VEAAEGALEAALQAAQASSCQYGGYRDIGAFCCALDLEALGAAFAARVLPPSQPPGPAGGAGSGAEGGGGGGAAGQQQACGGGEEEEKEWHVGADGGLPAVVVRATFEDLLQRLQRQLEALQVRAGEPHRLPGCAARGPNGKGLAWRTGSVQQAGLCTAGRAARARRAHTPRPPLPPQALPDHVDVGVVRLSLVLLREGLLPAPTRQLAALRALLPRLAGTLLNAFLEQVGGRADGRPGSRTAALAGGPPAGQGQGQGWDGHAGTGVWTRLLLAH
jgi:hypothetical protein